MKRHHVVLAGVVWLGFLGFAGWETRLASQQRAQIAALQIAQRQLDTEASSLRRARAATTTDLKQAEQQLAAMPPSSTAPDDASPERRDEIGRWIMQVRKLRQLFDANPAHRTPEMQFVTEDDWLRAAKINSLETEEDIRAAMASLRNQGVRVFGQKLRPVVSKYIADHPGTKPDSIDALAPYFDPAVDPALLARYTISEKPVTNIIMRDQPSWSVLTATPVDADYDERATIIGGAIMINSGLLNWMPELAARRSAAIADFRRQNPDQPAKGIDDLLPHFNPPLEPDLAERLRKKESQP